MKGFSNILEIRLQDGNKVDWETLPVEKKIEYCTQLNRQGMASGKKKVIRQFKSLYIVEGTYD